MKRNPPSQPPTASGRLAELPAAAPELIFQGSSSSGGAGSTAPGLYSTSGFDLIAVLSKVAARPNAQIDVGPVDMSCALLIVEARKHDFPILYASKPFENLTGYTEKEILGRNCRFLQSPDGNVTLGSRRRYCDNQSVYMLKNRTMMGKESQVPILNYKKGGQPFFNLITVVPVSMSDAGVDYFVGFQVDLVEQPNAILEKMKDGSYFVNYSHIGIPPSVPMADFFDRGPSLRGEPPHARRSLRRLRSLTCLV